MAKEKSKKPANWEKERQRSAATQAAKSQAGRDIFSDFPEVVDPERRERARQSLEYFCKTYYPSTFLLPWSKDHLKGIERIEAAVRNGGLFAYAMPRGSGKTSLAETAVQWAALFGYRQFPVLIGSDEGSALELLESIKSELENNDLLAEDFPEVCHSIRRLEGIAHRANGQIVARRLLCGNCGTEWDAWRTDDAGLVHPVRGCPECPEPDPDAVQVLVAERTHVYWSAKEIVLPTIPGSAASGAIIATTGITGRVRGMKFKRPDGQNVRPDLAVIDDPQTDESAKSPTQSAERVEIVCGAVLGLAGPGKKIAAVMPCTVIRPDDMADEILNRQKHPEWQGERTKLLYKEPTNSELWEKYRAIRAEGVRSGDEGKAGTAYYRANRKAMDAGAEVAWPERKNPDELSALQHAMNLRYDRGESAFGAEYQNEPIAKTVDAGEGLTADSIAARINNRGRGEIPDEAAHLVAFVDVQKPLLWWTVMAVAPNFTAWLVDYGCYPEQRREYFTMREAKVTLQTRYPDVGLEAQLYAGLTDVASNLLSREWARDDGTPAKISRCVVDANWGDSTEVVKKWCRESPHAAILTPSHGKYVGAASIPFSEYKKKPGDRLGLNWRMPVAARGQKIRHLLYDTNFWKSSLMSRLTVPMGGVGCLSLFGSEAQEHKLLAAHLTAEKGVRTFGRGREVVEWKVPPDRPDNHWLDCLVGCLVAASIEGAAIAETGGPVAAVKKERMKLSDRQKLRKSHG